ncbi:tetratricopeptide repeat-containing sensor histidine kinase [Xanthomarina sp. F2636L]|uniref:tetratricopeptide repeat-containing sensor histidine kinase n=1 Tax=Xanthomarina sp. F2636L TaxID=2996018 RepID=UPI00225E6FAD|nr:tetratricopeptide repeat-containing sensor histidine kinase [Xanthomarina sp. F2636L]MCX7551909.1 tetratricopeptide repeat-containing sensor histidine kinase [Xanthomarina sp. F2636L]
MKKLFSLVACLIFFIGFSQTKEQDSLTIQLAFQNSDTTKIETSLLLVKVLYKDKEYDKALKYISQTEKLSQKLNYQDGIAEITYYKALIYAYKNDYINARDNYLKAKELFIQLDDTLNIAKVNNSIGLNEIKRGNYNLGLQYALLALKEFEKRNLKNELRSAYECLAEAYFSINEVNKATEYYIKTLDAERQINNNEGSIHVLKRLAELYSLQKEHRKSIDYYEKVLKLTSVENDSLRGEILPKLGGEYLQFNDYDNALKYLVDGLRLNRDLKNSHGTLVSLNSLGDLNLRRNFLKYAEIQLFEAKDIASSINAKEQQLKNYDLLKSLDSTNRRFDRAFIWQREYYQLQNQIIKKETKPFVETKEPILVDNLGINNTIEENVDSKIGTRTAKDQQEFDRLRIVFYALLGAVVILSTFLVLIYIKRNSRLKYTRELEEKNLRIEIQNEAILEQTKHLEDINKVKDKLFSIVSHDLKDSLTSIKGFIDLLKDGSLTQEEFKSLIPELSENANNASLLLFNLLNWSKSQMQSLEPSPSLFDLQEVFEDKMNLLEQKLEKKGIILRDKTLRDFVYADKSMVEIIIQNLLTNAIKFSKKGDTITIANQISNGKSIISISDTGVGISKENQEKLFKNSSFTTVGTQNEKGTGLGLTICKELVDLNHGRIWVESDLNVGTTFYVELPKSNPQS